MNAQNITLARITVPAITRNGPTMKKSSGVPVTSTDRLNRKPRPDSNVPGIPIRNNADGLAASDCPNCEEVHSDALGNAGSPTTPPPETGKADDKWTDADGLQADFNAGAVQVTTIGGGRVTQTTRTNVGRHAG